MISVLIVEDEDLAREDLKYLIEKDSAFKVKYEASDGKEALNIINNNQIDVVFLDIKIPILSGIDVARYICNNKMQPLIVFVTAYDEYAAQAFRLSAIDYLLKPIDENDVYNVLEKIKIHLNKKQNISEQISTMIKAYFNTLDKPLLNKIAVVDKGQYLMISYEDIYFFYCEDKIVWAKCIDKTYITQFRLVELESILPKYFFRIHKSYIVNLNHIKSVIPWFKGNYQIEMDNDSHDKIPVSRNKVNTLNTLLHLKRK